MVFTPSHIKLHSHQKSLLYIYYTLKREVWSFQTLQREENQWSIHRLAWGPMLLARGGHCEEQLSIHMLWVWGGRLGIVDLLYSTLLWSIIHTGVRSWSSSPTSSELRCFLVFSRSVCSAPLVQDLLCSRYIGFACVIGNAQKLPFVVLDKLPSFPIFSKNHFFETIAIKFFGPFSKTKPNVVLVLLLPSSTEMDL